MSFFRSDPLGHYKLIMSRDSAWQIMNFLGELNMIHFVKSSKAVDHNPYTIQIKRCEQSLQKVEYLQKVLWQRRLYNPTIYYTKEELKELLKQISRKHIELQKQKSASILSEIEEEVNKNWSVYVGMNQRHQNLVKNVEFYRENMAIVIAGERIFGLQRLTRSISSTHHEHGHLGQMENSNGVLRINYGIIKKADQLSLQRTVFRVTRGHSYMQFVPFSDIFETLTPGQQSKSIYFIIYQGKKDNYVAKKLLKITEPYNLAHNKVYSIPHHNETESKVFMKLTESFEDSTRLLKMVEAELDNFLHQKLLKHEQRPLGSHKSVIYQKGPIYSKIQIMKIYLLKQLQILNHLKQMDLYDNFLQGEIYLKFSQFQQLKVKIKEFEKITRNPFVHIIPIDEEAPGRSTKKPTLFERNSFTRSAQEVVETYGIARYRQANPSLFTTVTFPFLFGVMFGDIGHGLILFLFGLIMIFKKYKLAKISDIFIMVVPHRYMFALMGFFSTYCGFIYNDFLSINLNLFGSCYNPNLVQAHQPIAREQNCIYPFGVDPIWGVAQNNLNYINSLKMKISVIIGVLHMTVGVIIKATNCLYFKRKVQFWFQTIPQLIFLVLVFGYMDFLIILKWLTPWGYGNPHAPSIISTMINFPLMLGKTDKQCCHGGQPMWGETGHSSQDTVQKYMLIIVFLCVPIMLLVKPIYEIYHHKKQQKHHKHQPVSSTDQDSEDGYSIFAEEQDYDEINNIKAPYDVKVYKSHRQMRKDMDLAGADQSHQPSEIFVHQTIQTIEFVLGCISNTASYLRLWALSLAHSQLSEVFMEKTLVGAFEQGGYVSIIQMVVLFPLFGAVTFSVLMCMDVMECFLHTLRLHWVEFQNKFYKGDGYAFNAYSFLDKINQQIRKTKLQGQPQLQKP